MLSLEKEAHSASSRLEAVQYFHTGAAAPSKLAMRASATR